MAPEMAVLGCYIHAKCRPNIHKIPVASLVLFRRWTEIMERVLAVI